MPGWRIKTASFLFLALTTAFPVEARAQAPAPWGVRVFSQSGWMYHARKIGKNAAVIQGHAANQVVAELNHSQVVGGGFEIVLPGPGIHLRAQVQTTLGGTAKGYLSICSEEGLGGSGIALCATDETLDARVVEGMVDVVFHSRGSTRLLQPMLWLGAGLRRYSFDADLPACTSSSIDGLEICHRLREIFENPSTDPLVTGGVGVTTRPGPVSAFVQLRGVLTNYTGGTGNADGERVTDAVFEGGVSVRVR